MLQKKKNLLKAINSYIPCPWWYGKFVVRKYKKKKLKKKLTQGLVSKKFFKENAKYRKRRYWFNQDDDLLDTFRIQCYEYWQYNKSSLKCYKCGYTSSRIKLLYKHAIKHSEPKPAFRKKQMKKLFFDCSYCPHVATSFNKLLEHVQVAHLEKKDYRKNKSDILKKNLEEIYAGIYDLNLKCSKNYSTFNLCSETDDKLSENEIECEKFKSEFQMSNVSEPTSSECIGVLQKCKIDSVKKDSGVSTRTYSAVCSTPNIELIPDKKIVNTKQTNFVSKNTLAPKPFNQQSKPKTSVEKHCCEICSITFSEVKDLEQHRQSQAHDTLLILCFTCSLVFSKIRDLEQHRKSTKHTKINILCSVCLSPFPSKYDLYIHIKTTKHKAVSKVFPIGSVYCATCKFIFKSKHVLEQHVLSGHINLMNYNCPFCDVNFLTIESFDQHKPICKHEVKNNLRKIYGRGFMLKSDLNQHMKSGAHKTQSSSNEKVLDKNNLKRSTKNKILDVVESFVERSMIKKKSLQHLNHTSQPPVSEFINIRQLLENTKQKNITSTSCNKQFTSEERIKLHTSDLHKSLSPLNEDTINKNSLILDKMMAEPKSENICSVIESNGVEQKLGRAITKRMICTICQQKFLSLKALEQHMNSTAHKPKAASFSTYRVAVDNNSEQKSRTYAKQEHRNIFSDVKLTHIGKQLERPTPKRIICLICYREFVADKDLEQHMNSTVHKPKAASFSTYQVAVDNNSEEKSRTYAEQELRNIFSDVKLTHIVKQLERPTPKRIICSICQKKFAAEIDLKQHMNSKVHKNASSCEYGAATNNNLLENHTIHAIKKPEVQLIGITKQMKGDLSKTVSSFINRVAVNENSIEHQISNTGYQKMTSNFCQKDLQLCNKNEVQESVPSFIRGVAINNNSKHQHMSQTGYQTGTSNIFQKEFSAEKGLRYHKELEFHESVSSLFKGVAINKYSIEQQIPNTGYQQVSCTERDLNENVSAFIRTVAITNNSIDLKISNAGYQKMTFNFCQKKFSDQKELELHKKSEIQESVSSFIRGVAVNNNSIEQKMSNSGYQQLSSTVSQKTFSTEKDLKHHGKGVVDDNVSSFIRGVIFNENSPGEHTTYSLQKPENLCSASDVGYRLGSIKPKSQKEFSAEETLESDVYKTVSSTTCRFAMDKNPQDQLTYYNKQYEETIFPFPDAPFKSSNILKENVESIEHEKSTCTICQKKFAAPSDLQQHMDSSVHKIGSFCCTDCGERFLNLKFLEQHIDSTGHQPVNSKCLICMKIFISEDALSQHMQNSKRHKTLKALYSEPKGIISTLGGKSDGKMLKCYVCPKKFKAKMDVDQHIMAVHEEIIFPCTTCNKIFYLEDSLNNHMKSTGHSYSLCVCPVCSSVFSSIYALEQHINNKVTNIC